VSDTLGTYCGTFSIAALDRETGQLGICTASCVLAVGRYVPHVKPRVAAVCTQSWSWPQLSEFIWLAVERGATPQQAIACAVAADSHPGVRQITVCDHLGRTAAYTGEKTQNSENAQWWGHVEDDGFVVAGNMLAGPETVEQTAAKYRELRDNGDGERLGWKLLCALEAGENAGGDKRGRQSAAIVVGRAEPEANEWYHQVDLRVDDHATPIQELMRLYRIQNKPPGA
jgi:uncharacterized Ntn-hydrolase superfamily protein